MRPPLIYFFAGIVWGFLLAYLFIGILDQRFSSTRKTSPVLAVSKPQLTYPDQYQLEIMSSEYRIEKGLRALSHDPKLCTYAEERLPEIQKDWSHDGFWKDGKSYGLYNGYKIIGENLAKDIIQAPDVLYAWKLSPSHNKNLLKTSYTSTCVRCFESYCVQLFGGK